MIYIMGDRRREIKRQ